MASSYGGMISGMTKPYRWLEFGLAPGRTNVGPLERLLSLAGGLALAIRGIRQRDLSGFVQAFLGGVMVTRAVTGHSTAKALLGVRPGQLPLGRGWSGGTVLVERSITIDKPADELFAFWRQFENLPQIMTHLLSVTPKGQSITRWVAKGPAGTTVEWDAIIVDERANELIAWRSIEGSQVQHAGSVQFRAAPANRGTEITVRLQVLIPGGKAGTMVAAMFGESPKQQISDDLRRFKQLMETGQIITIKGQSSCRGGDA